MSNGTTNTTTTPSGNGSKSSNGNNKLDIGVLNNGVKLLGEAVVPGASLLLEKHVGAGLLLTAVGLLGGAALGSAFGPFGYVLARYGASAASFSQSLQQPPPTNGSTAALQQHTTALKEQTSALQQQTSALSGLGHNVAAVLARAPAAFAPVAGPAPVAAPAAAQIDVVAALNNINNRFDQLEETIRSMQPATTGRAKSS